MVVADALNAELASRTTLAASVGSLLITCVRRMADTSGFCASLATSTASAGIIGVTASSEPSHAPESSHEVQASPSPICCRSMLFATILIPHADRPRAVPTHTPTCSGNRQELD